MFVEKLKKVLKKIQTFFKTLFKKHIRYQKIVTTFLYAFMFGVIIYTFWGYYYVGETVNPEIYNKTIEILLGLLGITGGMKISENITEAISTVASYKYETDNLRGGE